MKRQGAFCDSLEIGSKNGRGSDWNAYLRKVRGETVVITHPTHPFSGRALTVLHYRSGKLAPSVLVEYPDRTTQRVPLAWTDRAKPDPHAVMASENARLSGVALVELAQFVANWKKGT